HPLEIFATGFLARDIAITHHQREAVHAHVADGTAIEVRLPHHALQSRVAAVGGAETADAVAVGDALADGPFDGIGHVVDHRRAPVAVALLLEGIAVTARTTEVHLEHGIAAARQELGF